MTGADEARHGTKQQRFLLGTIAAGAGALAPLLLAEVVLRFLPVTEPVCAQPVNAGTPYRRFLPNCDIYCRLSQSAASAKQAAPGQDPVRRGRQTAPAVHAR